MVLLQNLSRKRCIGNCTVLNDTNKIYLVSERKEFRSQLISLKESVYSKEDEKFNSYLGNCMLFCIHKW